MLCLIFGTVNGNEDVQYTIGGTVLNTKYHNRK